LNIVKLHLLSADVDLLAGVSGSLPMLSVCCTAGSRSSNPPYVHLQRCSGAVKVYKASYIYARKGPREIGAHANPIAEVALVNVDYISPSLWLGVVVGVAGLILYSMKLQNARGTKDLDIVTASLLVLCGGILTIQGWRLDPILMLSEGVLASVGIYYIIQTVELRKQIMVRAIEMAAIMFADMVLRL
jgi:formate-dependent nitrite reductase membrane component NrfD